MATKTYSSASIVEEDLTDTSVILKQSESVTDKHAKWTPLRMLKYLTGGVVTTVFYKLLSLRQFWNGSAIEGNAIPITNSGGTDFTYITKANLIDETVPDYTVFGGELSFVNQTTIGINPLRTKDSTLTYIINLSAFTKTTGAWTIGTGAGGLDTGTIAVNKTYYVFAIYKSTTDDSDVLFSLSTTPALPSGWTNYKLIGSFKTIFDSAKIDYKKIYSYSEYQQYGVNGVPLSQNFRNDINFVLNGTDIYIYTPNYNYATCIEVRDLTNEYNLFISNDIVKTTGTFVAGYGNGMFEAALSNNTHYFIYIIGKAGGVECDIFASVNDIDTVTLPSGYTLKQIIGYGYTDSSANFYVRQYNEVNDPLPPCNIEKYEISYVDTDEFSVSQGNCRDIANQKNIFACFVMNKLTSAWAVGDGAGALQNSLTLTANTQYYVHIIGKNNQNDFDYVIDVVDEMVSLPTAAVTAGFTTQQLIGAFRTEVGTTNIDTNSITHRRTGKWENAVIHVQNVQPTGTGAGNTVNLAWTKRTINTIKKQSIPGSIINTTTYQVTLPIGFYKIEGFQMSYDVLITGRIYDTTNAVELIRFNHGDATPGNMPIAIHGSGYIIVTSPIVIEVQYYAGTVVVNGLGTAINLAGITELYLNLSILQLKNGD